MSIFNDIKEDVYMTADKMIKVVEEGASLLLGEKAQEDSSGHEPTEKIDDIFENGWDEHNNIDNPLNGIADSVLGDIMKNQVRCYSFRFIIFMLSSVRFFSTQSQ